MANIKKMDKETLRMLRREINQALESIGSKYNLDMHVGNASFNFSNATFKLHVCTKEESGEVITKEAHEFKVMAKYYGFEPSDLGKVFTLGGVSYKIAGLSSKSSKYPIIGSKVSDGKLFKFSQDIVKMALEK